MEKVIVSKNGARRVPLTQEEIDQRAVDEANAAAEKAIQDAEEARQQEIKASAFVADFEDLIRGKTMAEINTIATDATAGLDPKLARFIKYLIAKTALEVK